MVFRPFVEDNDWEGETWRFYIPVEGNEDALAALDAHVRADEYTSDAHRVEDKTLNEVEVDALVEHGGSGYMAYHHKLAGVLDGGAVLALRGEALARALYKGGIRNFVR